MKATIQVKSREEAAELDAGLSDPTARAFVKIMGILKALPTDRQRQRVLAFVRDEVAEQQDV